MTAYPALLSRRFAHCVVALASGVACGDTFGESRLRVYTATDATLLWERSFDVERVYAPPRAAGEPLLVLGADDCWGRDFASEYDAMTGEKLRDLAAPPVQDEAPAGDPPDPPYTCALPFGRVTLAGGEQVDVCDERDGVRQIVVRDVATGAQRSALPTAELIAVSIDGEHLLVHDVLGAEVDVLALASGEVVWTWTFTEELTVLGAHGGRAYFWDREGDVRALALEGGALSWERRLRCTWITLTGGLLACDLTQSESSCRDTDRLRYLGPSRS